jgi:hypothetical protein
MGSITRIEGKETALAEFTWFAMFAAMLVGWFFACRWVAEQPGKVHYVAYFMMLVFWPAGIPGAYVGTQRRKERLATAVSLPMPQPALPTMPPAP